MNVAAKRKIKKKSLPAGPKKKGGKKKKVKKKAEKKGFGFAALFVFSIDESDVWLARCKREDVMEVIERIRRCEVSLSSVPVQSSEYYDPVPIPVCSGSTYTAMPICTATITLLNIERPLEGEIFEFDATLTQVGKGKIVQKTVLEGLD